MVLKTILIFVCPFVLFLKTGFYCVAPAVLELTLVDQDLRDLPASTSRVLGLKMCATNAWLILTFLVLSSF